MATDLEMEVQGFVSASVTEAIIAIKSKIK
jgi:hypothetical protein